MTEEQARKASKLIKKLDETISLKERILSQFRKAQEGDSAALEWITNTALMLQEDVIDHIKQNIRAID